MPLIVVELLIQRTRPWITVPVPSVTISESTPKNTITAPFTNPASSLKVEKVFPRLI